jgi:hypothetical protein
MARREAGTQKRKRLIRCLEAAAFHRYDFLCRGSDVFQFVGQFGRPGAGFLIRDVQINQHVRTGGNHALARLATNGAVRPADQPAQFLALELRQDRSRGDIHDGQTRQLEALRGEVRQAKFVDQLSSIGGPDGRRIPKHFHVERLRNAAAGASMAIATSRKTAILEKRMRASGVAWRVRAEPNAAGAEHESPAGAWSGRFAISQCALHSFRSNR